MKQKMWHIVEKWTSGYNWITCHVAIDHIVISWDGGTNSLGWCYSNIYRQYAHSQSPTLLRNYNKELDTNWPTWCNYSQTQQFYPLFLHFIDLYYELKGNLNFHSMAHIKIFFLWAMSKTCSSNIANLCSESIGFLSYASTMARVWDFFL